MGSPAEKEGAGAAAAAAPAGGVGAGTGAGAGGGQERRGRFKIRQVEAAEAEDSGLPEGEILGGRVKGGDGHHHPHPHAHTAPLSTSSSSSSSTVPHGPPQRLPTTADFSAVSDLTASDSGPKTGASEKKGRFIIRELPEGSESGGAGSHHVHIDPTPHVYTHHGGHHHHHHGHHHGHHHHGPSSRPPPHPHGYHGAPLPRASSAQHLDTHSLRGSGHGHGPSSHHPHGHLDGSGGTASTPHDSYGAPLSSPSTYSPHHPHHFQFASSSASLTHETTTLGATAASAYFGFDEGMARTLKQQNDMILQRLVLMEKTLAQHPSPAQGSGGGGGLSLSSSALAHSGSVPAALANMEKGVSGSGAKRGAESSTPAGTKDITTGKLTYLLDQMKVEVESAVSKRRELDLQMKRLQEKNRALEERVDEERRKRVDVEKRLKTLAQELAALKGGSASSAAAATGGGAGGSSGGMAASQSFPDFMQAQQQQQQQQQQQGGGTVVAPIPITVPAPAPSSKPSTPDLPPATGAGVPQRATSSPGPQGSSSGAGGPQQQQGQQAQGQGQGQGQGGGKPGGADPFDSLMGNLGSNSGSSVISVPTPGSGGASVAGATQPPPSRGRGTSDVSNNATAGKGAPAVGHPPQSGHGRRESNLV